MDFIKIAYRNIFRNLRRSILCLVAVSLAVFLIVFMMSFIEGMISSAKRIAQTFESGHIKITTKEFEDKEMFLPLQYPVNDYKKYIEEIKDIDGVKHVSSRILSYATFTSSKVKHGFVGGIDFNDIENAAKDKVKNKYAYYNYANKSNGLIKGRLPKNNKNECMIGYRLAKKMELVPPIIEYYEYNWLLENIEKDELKKVFKGSYNFDEEKNIYTLNLFQNDNWENKNGHSTLSKNELKKIKVNSRKNYLDLLDALITLEIKSLPDKVSPESSVIDYISLKEYQKDFFSTAYFFNKGDNLYTLKGGLSQDTTDRLFTVFEKSVDIRLPLKIISSQYSDKYYQPKLVGIFEYDYSILDQNYILVPFRKLQKLASLKDKTQSIYVFVDKLKDAPMIKEKIIEKISDDTIVVKDWTEFPFVAMFRQVEYIYVVIYAIFVIVASFLIINTIIMVIHERIKEIGMMGAIGMKRGEIVLVFFLEAVVLSFFGALFGTIFGGIITGITNNLPINMESMTGGIDFPVSNTIYIMFSLKILLKGFLFGTLLTSFCTIFPSLKSAFIEPVEALRR